MDATIFHNPRCSTSRKALDRLTEAGVQAAVVRYLDEGWTVEQLRDLFAAAGLTPAEAVRKREPLYRELGLDSADDETILAAMVEHPVLVERPFVVTAKGTRLARPLESLDDII